MYNQPVHKPLGSIDIIYTPVYTNFEKEVFHMTVAKLFQNGGSQAVRLPKEYRFEGSEVLISRVGDVVVMVPKLAYWTTMLNSLEIFTDDFMADEPEPLLPEERTTFDEIHA